MRSQDKQMDSKDIDVLVIGGGHAGVEAGLAAARMGCRTLIVTQMMQAIARMPCNPSIGGIAKSHLVFELDALGGEMARNTDAAGIQFRTLNASRGPAVQANRAQCDKQAYAWQMQKTIFGVRNLHVLEDEVVGIWLDGKDLLRGIRTAIRGDIRSKTVVFASGTALCGRIHIGREVKDGGGDGRPSSEVLSHSLREAGFQLRRFKTGTPPRLDEASIDWSKMEIQLGETPPPLFSWDARRKQSAGLWHAYREGVGTERLFHVEQGVSDCASMPEGSSQRKLFHVEHAGSDGQIPCWLTRTTAETHRIVRENLSRSALYGGGITGTGPRYCPSIEDKVVKFAGKDAHPVFLEPDGIRSPRIYPNGISNSLDREIQERLVRTIPGLENARLLAYAYAIEYDCIDTLELSSTLESRRIRGLFFAGQVNRTTGYEEAASQGFVAGVNAALQALDREPFVLSRQESYIGILIDDLVTKGTEEPYRMFTSRAERRLILRQDNARFRLYKHANRLGIVDPAFLSETERYESMISAEWARLATERHEGVSLDIWLARMRANYADMPNRLENLPPEVVRQIEIRSRYRGYIEQEERASVRAKATEAMKIPDWMDYEKIRALRFEAREKMMRLRPLDLGQASRIPGVTPADIAVLSIALSKGPP